MTEPDAEAIIDEAMSKGDLFKGRDDRVLKDGTVEVGIWWCGCMGCPLRYHRSVSRPTVKMMLVIMRLRAVMSASVGTSGNWHVLARM
jgi:hypothetical protein